MTQRGPPAWQINRSVLDCNRYMLENAIGCDVRFRVCSSGGASKVVPAHKFMLCSRSPVFEALFCGSFTVKAEDDEHLVEISDVEPEAFKLFLGYLYHEEVTLTPDNVLPVLYAANKYLLTSLTRECMEFLENKITVDTVCTILDHSVMYDECLLTEKCLNYLAPRTRRVLKTDSFLTLSPTALSKMLASDLLYLHGEPELICACVKWSTHRSANPNSELPDQELRELLRDNVGKLRFASMSAKEFAVALGKSSILTEEEKAKFYYYLLTKTDGEELKELGFNLRPRVRRSTRYQTLGKTAGWWTCNGPGDAISFSVDSPVSFVGASVYGGRDANTHFVTLELWVDRTDDIMLCKTEYKLDSDDTPEPQPVYSEDQNITLQPGLTYTVVVWIRGSITFYGQGGTDEITAHGVTFSFSRSDRSGNGTNIKSGQIPEVLFIPEEKAS